MTCSSFGSRPRGIHWRGIGTGPTTSRLRLTGNSLLKTARPAAWRSGRARSSSSLYTSTLTANPPPGAGLTVTWANRRIVCRFDSRRSRKPTESPFQGSPSIAAIFGWVTIVPESRFSVAMSKYSSRTATVAFQTVSKSDEGTISGFSATTRGAIRRIRRVPGRRAPRFRPRSA